MHRLTPLILIPILLFACNSSGSPVAPDPDHLPDVSDKVICNLPHWEFSLGGETFTYGFKDLWLHNHAPDRSVQAPVDPGTDMSDSDLCIYFAGHIVDDIFQGDWENWRACKIYGFFWAYFMGCNHATLMRFVYIVESHGIDVPDELDIFPPC